MHQMDVSQVLKKYPFDISIIVFQIIMLLIYENPVDNLKR